MAEYRKVQRLSSNRRLLAAAERRRLTWAEVQTTVEANIGRHPMPQLTSRRGQDHAWFDHPPTDDPLRPRIHFTSPDGRYPLAAVLHELAHLIHWYEDDRFPQAKTTAERRRIWHGPEFTAILDGLLQDWYES